MSNHLPEICGKKMKTTTSKHRHDIILHHGNTGWNTYFSSFIVSDCMQIEIKINSLDRRDGLCIGFSSSVENTDSKFFWPEDHFKSVGFKSDGKCFCDGTFMKQCSTYGMKPSDSIVKISILGNTIHFNNDTAVIPHRFTTIDFHLAISILCKNDSVSIMNVTKLTASDVSPETQREIVNRMEDKYRDKKKDKHYVLDKQWYKQWKEWLPPKESPGCIDNCLYTAVIPDDEANNIVSGFIHQSQTFLPNQHIPSVIVEMCLYYYGSCKLAKDAVCYVDYTRVNEDIWDFLQHLYGGGPKIKCGENVANILALFT
eukprot:262969_1